MTTYAQLLDDWLNYHAEAAAHWIRQQWGNPPDDAAAERQRDYPLSAKIECVRTAMNRLTDEAFEFAGTLPDPPDVMETVRDRLLGISLALDEEIERTIQTQEIFGESRPNPKKIRVLAEFPRNYIRKRYKLAALKKQLEQTRKSIAEGNVETSDKLPVSPRDSAPRLAEADLVAWWESLVPFRESMGEDALMSDVRRKHPRNSISRRRIRELKGPTKSGRKPRK